MSGTRKLAAILAADVVGYSRLAGADEERTLARLRALRGDLIDPAVAAHHGRIVKRTGDGALVEFRSVVDALLCALEVQTGVAERSEGVAPERQLRFRIGIHLGDVIEEADGDLMGDGVNIAARVEGAAEPGGICLSALAYESVRDKVDAAFTDLGEHELKNIARPLRLYAVAPTAAFLPTSSRQRGEEKQREALRSGGRPGEEGLPRLSIVVLPFANIGGDAAQEYFVDGVTESLTTDLSRITGSFVIARNTAFTYKGKSIDVSRVGRELNVRYVLEGSVQRGGNRLRVNVQLIDAATGSHLWAERFDKPVADLFDMQDEIVARLASQLNTELVAAEARRAQRAPDPDSVDMYFQGMAAINNGWSPENMATARRFFDRALALDPNNIDALEGLAWVSNLAAATWLADNPAEIFAAAERAATKALSLAPSRARAQFLLGAAHIFTHRVTQGIAECQYALSLDRNWAAAHVMIGVGEYLSGRAEETERHIAEALRLSPRDPIAHGWFHQAGFAKLLLGRDDEAVAWYRKSIDANRNLPAARFMIAAALANLGRLDEAKAAVQAGLSLAPNFTVRRFVDAGQSDNATYLSQRERIIDGMRNAGVPD